MILRDGADCCRVNVVFDVYREVSIKGSERERRSQAADSKVDDIRAGRKLQQWKKFLASSENKTHFINFVTDSWMELDSLRKLGNKVIYITNGDLCRKLTCSLVEAVHDLCSSHEEADTRLLLHASHAASNRMHTVVVVADDTAVLILLIAFAHCMTAEVYMKSGSAGNAKVYCITNVSKSLNQAVCGALPGLHAFTGCDSVSALAGKGKVNAYKLMCKDKRYQEAFQIWAKAGN